MNFGKDEEPAPPPKKVDPKDVKGGKDAKGAPAAADKSGKKTEWTPPPAPMPKPAPPGPDGEITTYNTFEACYMAKIHGKPPISRDEKYKEAEKEWAGKETIDGLRAYEKKFDCSGICDVPLFYLTKELSEGPP